jgi:hypothetical protein
MRIVFEEICFMNRLTIDQVLKYEKYLIKRIHDIETQIDSHFELIKDAVVDSIR